MQWNNGILNPNFLTGKAAYIEAMELPITTEEIKQPTIEDLANAFETGDAVEISTILIRSESKQASTGHVLTGVSAYQDGSEAGLAVHDPATPQGADILDMSMTAGDNQFINLKYPMWDGLMLVDAIYVQRWNEPVTESEPEETSMGLEPIDPAMELAFAHLGDYSEVYASVTGLTPGIEYEARLKGGSHTGTPQIVTADENGVAYYTWRISQYGDYVVQMFGAASGLVDPVAITVD
jgi:hypothetical protein